MIGAAKFPENPAQVSALLLAAAVVICVVAYHATVSDLLQLWSFSGTSGYAHGGLLFLMGAYLAFERWRTCQPPIDPDFVGVCAVFLLSLAWLLAGLVFVQVLQQVALLALLPATAWALLGVRGLRPLAFALLLPIFGLPWWEIINQTGLQVLTAAAVEQLLAAGGIPVTRQGVLLHIPAGVFRVAENCSGMRQLVVSVPVAAAAAYLAGFRLAGISFFAMFAGCLALAVNMLRIYVVVLAGHVTDMQHYLVTEDHVVLGWVMFAVAITALVMLITSIRAPDDQSRLVKADVPPGVRRGLLVALVPALLAGPLLNWHLNRQVPIAIENLTLPAQLGDWHLQPLQTGYEPVHAEADRKVAGSYRSSRHGVVTLRIATFVLQTQGREAVSSRNRLADQRTWSSTAPPSRIDAGPFTVDEVVVAESGGQQLLRVWGWYRTPAGSSAGLLEAKSLELWSRFTNPGETAIVTLAHNEPDDPAASRLALTEFVNALQAPSARVF